MFSDVQKAVEVLKKGGIIIYPTDTIWGIGCDATNPEAVRRLYDIKKRSDDKPMLVLVDSTLALERTVSDIPEVAYDLIEASDKPLTIIFEHPTGVAPALLGSDGSLGVRVTKEPFSAALCRTLRHPIVSTSANFSGKPAARKFSDIDPELLSKADYVCLSRRDEENKCGPSGIIKLGSGGLFKIIR